MGAKHRRSKVAYIPTERILDLFMGKCLLSFAPDPPADIELIAVYNDDISDCFVLRLISSEFPEHVELQPLPRLVPVFSYLDGQVVEVRGFGDF